MYLLGKNKLLLKIFAIMLCLISSYAIARSWDSAAEVYIVKPGEDWKKLEKKFDIPAKALQRYNKSLGPKVNIPAKIIYQVKDGETSLGIAVKYGMTFSELIALNNLQDPYAVKLGQKLKVMVLKTQDNLVIKPANNIKLQLSWPLKGKITSKFGIQENGANHDGIRLLGVNDDKVKAVAKGKIVYVGNEIGSYGNLVIIQHDGDWFSSYGHLSTINVTKGEEVKLKQIIGTIENAELYFSLRKREKAMDPQKYLPKRVKRKK